MKHLIYVFLVIGVVVFFFGCQKDNLTSPDLNQSDQAEAPVLNKSDRVLVPWTKTKTAFTGTSNFKQLLEPATETLLPNGKTLLSGEVAEWYDEASDPRVTGQSIWVVNKLLNEDGSGKVWGTADIFVDNDGGRWEILWWGSVSSEGVVAKAVGTGIEGDVKGLVAKWTYTMIFENGIFYTSKGYIY